MKIPIGTMGPTADCNLHHWWPAARTFTHTGGDDVLVALGNQVFSLEGDIRYQSNLRCHVGARAVRNLLLAGLSVRLHRLMLAR